MARMIQGKHFSSESELIIDPFPELQMTLVRAKSAEKRRKLKGQMEPSFRKHGPPTKSFH